MIRMIQSQSSGHAKAYYVDALQKTDYYVNDVELPGQWHGALSQRLGIEGEVKKEQFFAMCDNLHPVTGKPLTPRKIENRTVGYDINFHAPKSLSVLNFMATDNHIQDAFQESVVEAMKHIEADIMTRVRVNGKDHDRKASELSYANFLHLTARPVDGSTPDPHLHCHCFVMNAAFDDVEQKIKAGQFREIKKSMPYHQALFHKILSDKLIDLGYSITKTDKSFEIDGVPKRVIELFSKRTNEIGQFAKENGITDEKILSELGARTRSKKTKGLSMSELKSEWRNQIKNNIVFSVGEQETKLRYAPAKEQLPIITADCIDHAIEHSFERKSVMEERRLLEQAYKHSIGVRSVSIDDITAALEIDEQVIRVQDKGQILYTTKNALREEKHMISLAEKGINQFSPIYDTLPRIRATEQQALAIEHILTTTDQVSIVMGAAGSGKTTLMSEAIEHIENAGIKVTVVAPTARASRGVLKDEGFDNADTVSKLLLDNQMQEAIKNNVLWVDEAGLLSNPQMISLLELCQKQKARLILGGDTRQHSSVERGDALRVMNMIGGIRAAEVNKIYRQKDEYYREAVQDLAIGNVASAFNKLDKIGAIIEVDPLRPNEQLVSDYIETVKRGKKALIVSPTHKQGNALTSEIRDKLKQQGIIGKNEIKVDRFINTNMTEAERSDWRNYRENQMIQFNQNTSKIKRGSLWSIDNIENATITLKNKNGDKQTLPMDKAKDFSVYHKTEISLAKGDKIVITNNSHDRTGKRLDNGTELEVSAINKVGKAIFKNPVSKREITLEKDFGHLAHNYFTTSHSSQGKTVDEIFISQPAATFSATDSKQFYVSVSRGRERARIYTDDSKELLRNAEVTRNRQSAIELTMSHSDYVAMQERQKSKTIDDLEPSKTQQQSRYKDYEPEL
jgi:conjugative relaxase-like TrwC/TraI family protein